MACWWLLVEATQKRSVDCDFSAFDSAETFGATVENVSIDDSVVKTTVFEVQIILLCVPQSLQLAEFESDEC